MTSLRLDSRQVRELVAPIAFDDDTDAVARAYAAAVWSCLIEPGDRVAGRLIAVHGVVGALEVVLAGDVHGADAAGIGADEWSPATARWNPRLDPETVDFALRTARGAGIRLLTAAAPEWPPGLDDLGDHAPVCLWVRGDVAALAGSWPSAAIVGARAATGYGEHVAGEIAAELAGGHVGIVSGAAYGIDGAAHRAALAAGGATIAVLAGGVDRPYPAGHADLIRRIARAGAVIAEVPPGAAPTKWRFLQRNRLIAALGAATVVVEAGWRSGSLNTAGHAAALGRPLGAVPGPVTSAASAGCHRLLREYDARCVTCADEVLELLGAGTDQPLFDLPVETAEATRVRDALSTRTPRDVADIARRCGLSAADTAAQLGLFALDGTARDDGDGWHLLR